MAKPAPVSKTSAVPARHRLRDFWQKKKKVILRGMLVGVVVHAILLFYPIRLTHFLESAGVDWIMKAEAERHWAAQPDDPAFVFLDIDNDTIAKWPAVPYTPRDKLLKLIQYAVNGGAAVVIVDVNLSEPINPLSPRHDLSPDDKNLAGYLGEYSRRPALQTKDGREECRPVIILDRHLQRTPKGCWTLKKSFLDPSIDESSGTVQWGSVQFNVDPDALVRFWRLWEQTCDFKRPLFPSVEWLAAWRIKHRHDATPRCSPEPADFDVPHNRDLAERIVYRIPWEAGPESDRPQVTLGSATVPIFAVIPAAEVTDAPADHEISGEGVRDRIVIIGGSNDDARDLHATPIGEMPGSLVIVNSIYSLYRFNALGKIPVLIEFLVSVLLIGLASAVFASLHHLWAYLLSGVLTLAAVLPLTVLSFQSGYWLDFVIPLLAVQAHHFIAQFEEAFERRHEHEANP